MPVIDKAGFEPATSGYAPVLYQAELLARYSWLAK